MIKNVIDCTGCEACVNICPKQCISMKKDKYLVEYPVTDDKNCIHCGICKHICPQLNGVKKSYPVNCYAAYRNDSEKRADSASGGVASALYEKWVAAGEYVVGVSWSSEELYEAEYKVTNDFNELMYFKGSKYVHAKIADCYKIIENKLKQHKKLLFVGLPCQLAGLISYLKYKRISTDSLFVVDLICHGTCPKDYLLQEVDFIKQKYHIKSGIKNISFRSNRSKRENRFVVTGGKKDDSKILKSWLDDYQPYYYGFLHGITLRENCYQCIYSESGRLGDITIGDFLNLGNIDGFPEFRRKGANSIILVNTEKGKKLVDFLKQSDVSLFERSVTEGIKQGISLQKPFPKHKLRNTFCEHMESKKAIFPKAIRKTIWKQVTYNKYIVRYFNFICRKMKISLKLKHR